MSGTTIRLKDGGLRIRHVYASTKLLMVLCLPQRVMGTNRGLRDLTLYLVTDQCPYTGIGNYAQNLYRLVRPLFRAVELTSLCYNSGAFSVRTRRFPGTKFAKSRILMPFVLRNNDHTLISSVRPNEAIHFCGISYYPVQHFSNCVVTVHDYYPRQPIFRGTSDPLTWARDLSSLQQFLTLPRLIRSAREIVVPTEHVRHRLLKRTSLVSRTIHHWVDQNRFLPRDKGLARKKLGLPLERALVLNVSGGTSNKNYPLLRDIANSLSPGACMVKVGAPIRKSEKVILLPQLSEEEYPLVFNACDVYVHTSSEEGFGWPLVEAMASRMPIIATRTPVTEEVIGDAGVFISPEDSERRWIDEIDRLDKASLRDELIEQERLRCRALSPESALVAYEKMYRDAFLASGAASK